LTTRQKLGISRDAAIVATALALSVYEVTLGGGRASVLAFLGGLLVAPVALRVDQARREAKNGRGERDAEAS
jgi:hypothetical protein